MKSTLTSEPPRATSRPGAPHVTEGARGAARRHGRAWRRELQRLLEARDGPRSPAVRSRRRCPAGAGDADRSGDEPAVSLLARVRARSARRGRSTDSARPAPSTRRTAIGSIRKRFCSIRTDARVVVPEGLRPRGGRTEGRQRRDGDEERGGRSVRLRLGRRSSSAHAVVADRRLRDARARVHAASELGRLRARRAAPTPG